IARILSPDTATSALIHGAPVPSNTKPFSMMTSALSVELSCANTPLVDASSVDSSTADSLVMVLSFEVVQNDREATRDILPAPRTRENAGRYDLNDRPACLKTVNIIYGVVQCKKRIGQRPLDSATSCRNGLPRLTCTCRTSVSRHPG